MSGHRKYPVAAEDHILHPLKIELVLEKVFSFLKPDDLKNCRLVCKLWKDEASDDLGSQTYLAMQSLQNRIQTIPVIHPRLLQRIKIHLEGTESVKSYLVPFLTDHRGQVEWIRIIGANYFLPTLKTILEAVEFPNLTKISLEESYLKMERCLIPSPTLDVSLSRIKILELLGHQNGSGGTKAANFSAFQLLINKCTNLEGLKIVWHFCPDLSSCAKLKSLHWVGPVAEKEGERYLEQYYFTYQTWPSSIRKLIEMLHPVKDTLQNLILSSSFQDGYQIYKLKPDTKCFYLYPRMPKLTKLCVSDVMMFCIHEDSFIQSRLPALKILTLKSTRAMKFSIKPLLLKWKRDESKLNAETVSINQFPVGKVQIISDIATTFPNLKKLTLGITEKSATGGSTSRNAQLLKNTLNAISQELPTLTELTIHIEFSYTLAELVDGICAEGLNGKDLKLKVVIPKSDSFQDNFEQGVTFYHNGLTLEGFEMKDDTRQKMRDFIRERYFPGLLE